MLQDCRVLDTEQNVLCHIADKFPGFHVFECTFWRCCYEKQHCSKRICIWPVNHRQATAKLVSKIFCIIMKLTGFRILFFIFKVLSIPEDNSKPNVCFSVNV